MLKSESGKNFNLFRSNKGSGDGRNRMVTQSSLLEHFVKFKTEPSVETRAELTGIICEQFNSGQFRAQEKDIVKEILGFLSRDVETKIRQAVSETMKENDDLPHDVAMRLAKDVEAVANPILEFSNVLTDEDLEEIIASVEQAGKIEAIAKRKNVSEKISASIIETKEKIAVEALVANDGAKIADESKERVVDYFGSSEDVMAALIKRGNLSSTLAERMVTLVSEKLQNKLAEEYHIRPLALRTTFGASNEKVVLGVISENTDKMGVQNLVDQLYKTGKLTHSIVLRALCRADLEFFEVGMAKLAGIPAVNARKLIRTSDKKGFEALFNAASMPSTMKEAAETLLSLILESERKEGEDSSLFSRRLIENIISKGYDHDIPNMQYFVTLISSNAGNIHKRALLN